MFLSDPYEQQQQQQHQQQAEWPSNDRWKLNDSDEGWLAKNFRQAAWKNELQCKLIVKFWS